MSLLDGDVISELAMVADVVLTFTDSLQLVRIADNADHCNSDGRSVRLSVCLSVCPTRSNVLPRGMKIHRRSQDFFWGGVHFFPQKVDDLFLVVVPQNSV